MKKIYTLLFVSLFLLNANNSIFAQSVLDPTDPVITYNANTPPAQPTWGQIGKWVRAKRLSWNTDSYKAYIYKGSAFRLKFPKSYNPTANDGKKYPMLVFFHGLGETGNIYDNEYQLYHGGQGFSNAVDNGTFDGYILCMQSSGFWGSGQYNSIKEIIDYMAANNKLDPFHIADNGLSAGGQGTWEMMFNYPAYISAAVPMSSTSIGYKDNSSINITKYTSIWLFQGGADGSPAPYTSQQVRDAYVSAGANFTYTEYPGLGHDVWESAWAEPDFYPFLLRAYGSNPYSLHGRTEFCPGDNINVTMGLAPGFDEYQWRQDGTVITGATSNSIVATSLGTYDARVRKGSFWSDWSYTPVVIKIKTPTVPPAITIQGLMSTAIPAPDGNNFANLQVSANYTNYTWKKVGSDSVYGTANILKVTQPGDYKVSVIEQFGCSSVFSSPFTVINANGANAPSSASSLTAVPRSNTQIELNWAQNPKPLSNETAFEIYRSTKPGNSYVYLGQVPKDTVSFVDNGLLAATKYYYIVRAINSNGASPVSNEASAITETDNIPPSAPKNLSVASTTNTSVNLVWNVATDNVGIERYDVYVNGVKNYTTKDTTIRVNGLQSGTLYTFYVKAKDLSGNYSIQSSQVSAPALSQGLQYKYYEGSWNTLPDFNTLTPVKSGTSSNTDLSVRSRDDQFGFVWQGFIKVPVTGTYTFETNSDDGSKLWLGTYNASATPLVNNDGLHGAQYVAGTVTLQAGIYPISAAFFEQGGDQVMQLYWTCSAAFGDNNRHAITDNYFKDSYTPAGIAPLTPITLKAQVLAYNKIKLTWTDKSNNETGFEVYRATSASGPFQIVGTADANAITFTDSSLSAATTYYYQVNAVNAYGSSFGSGLRYSYYAGTWSNLPDFNTLTPVKTGYLNNVSLSPANATTNYAFKYEGSINILTAGSYTFYTTSDDGSKLYIDGFAASNVVVNNDFLQAPTERSGTKTLTKGVHQIYITYFQQGGGAALSAAYQGPNISKQSIPDSAFIISSASAKTSALPAAPTLPASVKAVAQSSSAIALTWTDRATNETGYKLYRSVNDSLHFKFLASLPVNSNAYTDSSLFAHLTYWYRVSVLGAGGTNNAKIVSAKTKDNAPVITDIASRSVTYGIKTIINITATDVDADSLTFTILNRPSWATFANNKNNTATLTLNPKLANQGTVSNVRIIVNDNNGIRDTTAPFTFTINSNYDPAFDSIADYTLNENDNLTINLNGHDQNATDVLTWSVTNVPNAFNITTVNNTAAQLVLHPNYAATGTYAVNVKVSDGNGGIATRIFNLSVNDRDPNFTIYTRFKFYNDLGAPWNNITGLQTNNLKDDKGNTTNVGFNILSDWFGTNGQGSSTGNNSGIYPDAVLSDYYYVGLWAGADTARIQITNPDTSFKYNLTLFSSSTWPQTADNGSTVFTSGNQTVSLNVQNNTQNTVTLANLKPDSSGSIYFTMKEGADALRASLNSVIINSSFNDGTVPAAPKSLFAQDTTNGVTLSWTDLSYNEDSFYIYRSSTQLSGYVLLAALGVNKTVYIDTLVHANSQYYYKILALNDIGNSPYSNIADILTNNNIPVLENIGNVIIKNNTQLTIPVIAKDDVIDNVTLTVSQLPAFATFTSNGNGTGSLFINPTTSTVGFYPGVTITAKDNSGAISTTKFDITVTDATKTSVYLNFTDAANQAIKPWNNLTGFPFAGATFNNIKDDSDNPTGISVTLVEGFERIAAEGMKPGNDRGIYPDPVMRTSEIESSTNTKTIKITGLSITKKYNFVFFNSHQDGLKGNTAFTINGQSVSLDAAYNINKTVQINGITPDANGQVNVLVAKAAGADYSYISSLIIQAYDNSTSLINPAGLIVTENKRTSVSLSWADQSTNETGFEMWRADSSSGSYKLISTVSANTTTFTDQNLIQNKTYYYVVRAKNDNGQSAFSNVAIAHTLAFATYVNFTIDSIAPSPWYNTLVPPQKGYTWTNFMDEINNPISMTMTQLEDFTGVLSYGVITGNNSGVYPDRVIYQSYGAYQGQAGSFKLSNLNLNMNYDITFFASTFAWGDINVAYIVNGKTLLLDASLNTHGTVTAYGIRPDNNGEINITIAPGTPTSLYGMISAMVIQAYSDPVLTLPSSLPQSFANIIASATAQKPDKEAFEQVKVTFESLTVYPNPYTNNFTLSFKLMAKDDVMVEIYDLSGRPIYQNRFLNLPGGSNSIRIAPQNSLSSGLYLLKLTALNRKATKTIKIIKQH